MLKEIHLKQLTLFQEDSPVSLSPLQASKKEEMTIDISGMKLLESLPNSNRGGLLEKMLTDLLTSKTAWCSDRCKMTWKPRVSKSNVLLFQLQASVVGIKEKESGLSDTMYPTPSAQEAGEKIVETLTNKDGLPLKPNERAYNPKTGKHLQMTLNRAIKLYPTPRASSAMTENLKTVKKRVDNRGKLGAKLEETVATLMYPTPNTNDGMTSPTEDIENWEKRAEEKKKKGINLHYALRHAVQREEKINTGVGLYPTPTTQDSNKATKRWRENRQNNLTAAVFNPDKIKKIYNTPTTSDWKNTSFPKSQKNRDSIVGDLMQEKNPPKVGGRLNPTFVEFLMGYPMNWTKIESEE